MRGLSRSRSASERRTREARQRGIGRDRHRQMAVTIDRALAMCGSVDMPIAGFRWNSSIVWSQGASRGRLNHMADEWIFWLRLRSAAVPCSTLEGA